MREFHCWAGGGAIDELFLAVLFTILENIN